MSEDKDLNINNYNKDEILKLYQLDNYHTIKHEDLDRIKQTINIVKTQLSSSYLNLYYRAYKIILFINNLIQQNIILDSDNEIQKYVQKIKMIDNFPKYKVNEMIILLKQNDTIHEANMEYDDILKNVKSSPPPTIKEQIHTDNVTTTNPSTTNPGLLNSIKRITQLLNLNLNSCFRQNHTQLSTNYQYLLPCELKNVVSMRLASIEVPNAWYTFSSAKKTNSFQIILDNAGIISEYTITIPDGNYDSNSLMDYLNNNFFYLSSTTTDLIYIQYSIDEYNFKSKFELVGLYPPSLSFSLIFENNDFKCNYNRQNCKSTFGWIIGFRLPKYEDITSFIYSEALFDGAGTKYVYLAVNDYQYNTNPYNIICFSDSILDKNILAKIPMVNGKLSMVMDDIDCPLIKIRKYNGPVNIRNLHISLIDEYGDIVDLNLMDFSFTLEVELLYEGFNFNNINK